MSTNKYLNTFSTFKEYSDYMSSLGAYFPNVCYVEDDGVYVNKTGLADYAMVFRCQKQEWSLGGIPVKYDSSSYENIDDGFTYINFVKNEDVTEIPTYWYGIFESSKFYDCRKWDIDMSGVTSLEYTFANCKRLKSLKFAENWNVENVQAFYYMCSTTGIERADLKNWVNDKATNVFYMFASCENLKYIDIRNLSSKNWNDNPFSNLNFMVSMSSQIRTLYIGERFFDWYEQNGSVIESGTHLDWFLGGWTDIDSLTMFINAFPQRDTATYGVCRIGFPSDMYNTVANNTELMATLQTKGYELYQS